MVRGYCELSSRNVFLFSRSSTVGCTSPLTSVARETRVCAPGVAPFHSQVKSFQEYFVWDESIAARRQGPSSIRLTDSSGRAVGQSEARSAGSSCASDWRRGFTRIRVIAVSAHFTRRRSSRPAACGPSAWYFPIYDLLDVDVESHLTFGAHTTWA
jgi:hypothetical protein